MCIIDKDFKSKTNQVKTTTKRERKIPIPVYDVINVLFVHTHGNWIVQNVDVTKKIPQKIEQMY